MPGAPASSTVGISGAASSRLSDVTASALTLPPLMCDSEVIAWSKVKSIWPAVMSRMMSEEPDLYGTNWNFMPVIFWK